MRCTSEDIKLSMILKARWQEAEQQGQSAAEQQWADVSRQDKSIQLRLIKE